MKHVLAIATVCALGAVLAGCVTVEQACKYRPMATAGINLAGMVVELGPEAKDIRGRAATAADAFCGDPAKKRK